MAKVTPENIQAQAKALFNEKMNDILRQLDEKLMQRCITEKYCNDKPLVVDATFIDNIMHDCWDWPEIEKRIHDYYNGAWKISCEIDRRSIDGQYRALKFEPL